ncbi:MAG: SDR family oxidoreductase [Tenacibaculum sp.]
MSKVVLITGASSGIGKQVALYLHNKNYTVYGTSRNPDKVKVPFSMLALDLTKSKTIRSVVEKIQQQQTSIDVLINNAGRGIAGPIEETPIDEMRVNFETNFFGVIELIKVVLPVMRKQQNGLIINITSIASYTGLPFRGIYSASKGALALVTEALSMELKSLGIKCLTIAPGEFATNIDASRFHTPVFEKSAYKEKYSTNLALMNKQLKRGKDPVLIAQLICSIIESKNHKIHYKIGSFIEKFSIVLKRILPDKIYQKLMMNHFKL